MQEALVHFLGWEDPLEKGKATHSSVSLEKSMEWIVHGVTESQTRLRDFHVTSVCVCVYRKWLLRF